MFVYYKQFFVSGLIWMSFNSSPAFSPHLDVKEIKKKKENTKRIGNGCIREIHEA